MNEPGSSSTQKLDSPATISKTNSVRSKQSAAPPTIKTVITAPPWAKDEPPSPTDNNPVSSSALSVMSDHPQPSASTVSREGTAMSNSTSPPEQADGQSWWTFISGSKPPRSMSRSKTRPVSGWPLINSISEKRPWTMAERSKTMLTQRSSTSGAISVGKPKEGNATENGEHNPWNFNISHPQSPADLLTLKQARTPGWNQPWSPRQPQTRETNQESEHDEHDEDDANLESGRGDNWEGRPIWYRRRKRLRAFILSNNYVPLLFRVINITFTIAALIVAVHIRREEKRFGIMGAIGSSPTLVIIFAPLTIVHVMAAIYLEYFGRPLGLWRTSMKLIHTLSETLFICAWSAALSLCFDNFFTSVLECTPTSSTAWYDEIPRVVPDHPHLGRGPGEPADGLCDHQVALICLVGVGLLMYCSNLFISLFRIFEKVKYHNPPPLTS